MPFVVLALFFLYMLFMFGKRIYDELTKNHHAFTAEELDQMNREVIGKSKKECQQIIKKYSK